MQQHSVLECVLGCDTQQLCECVVKRLAHLHTVHSFLAHNEGREKNHFKKKKSQFTGDVQLTGKQNTGIRDTLFIIPSEIAQIKWKWADAGVFSCIFAAAAEKESSHGITAFMK